MALQTDLMLLVLIAALLHASWNALVKVSGDRVLTFAAIRLTGSLIALPLLPVVPLPAVEAWPFLVASVCIHNAYYITLLNAYRVGDLSHVYPLARGVAPLTVAIFAALFAGEVPTPGGLAGTVLVSIGIISLMFAGGGIRGAAALPVALALLTGLWIATYTVVDGLGTRAAGLAFSYIVWLNLGEGLPYVAYAAIRRKAFMPVFRRHWPKTTGAALMIVTAYGLVLYALGQGAMAHVSALRETSVLFATLIGSYLLKESFGGMRIAAAAIIVAGVVIMQAIG